MTGRTEAKRVNPMVVALYLTGFLGLVMVAMLAPRGGMLLVVTDPRAPQTHGFSVVATAGGSFVAHGRYSWLTIASSPQEDFASRLLSAGALLVIDIAPVTICVKRS